MLQRSLFDQLPDDQTSSAQDGHAKVTPWLESVVAWLTSEADCGEKSGEPSKSLPPVGFLAKTSPVFCRSVAVGFVPPSALSELCTTSDTSNCTPTPESVASALDAMNADEFSTFIRGEITSVCWPTWQNCGMGSPTAFLTLSGSEWPSDADVCSLSDVLETGNVPPEYFLSPTACRGILRRAGNRGRELPHVLHEALKAVAGEDMPAEDGKTITTSPCA